MLRYSEAIREVDHRVKTIGKEKKPLVASPAKDRVGGSGVDPSLCRTSRYSATRASVRFANQHCPPRG
jgi:hypothetical protein